MISKEELENKRKCSVFVEPREPYLELLDEIERLQAAFCGIDPADLPKFVEAIRLFDKVRKNYDARSICQHTRIMAEQKGKEAAGCLPENKPCNKKQ